MINRPSLLVVALALVSPSIFAQQQSKPEPQPSYIQRQQNLLQRESKNNSREMRQGYDQAWRNAMTNQTKLRAKLTEAWLGMGLSPQAAKTVADAYDADFASQTHHTSLRGKSDQEVATMLQSALASKRYQVADQLLIDYQRSKLSLSEMGTSDPHKALTGG